MLGDVTQSTQFPIDNGGARVLDAIARAGGPRFPAYETIVTLQRAGMAERARLSDMARRPEQNVQLRGGDVIFVGREPRYFLAMGATGPLASSSPVNRRMPFEGEAISLGDALARAGGLQDDRADARAVFVFRNERPETARSLGGEVPANFTTMPTVYWVDMSDPAGLFLANGFPMRDQDVIFDSTAASVDVVKFLQVVIPFANTGIALGAVTR